MNERLKRYMWEVYERDILGKESVVEVPEMTPELIAEAKAEMARIEGLRLGASLSSRDFAAYQARRALAGLLAKTEK
jgi:hypothetical protein